MLFTDLILKSKPQCIISLISDTSYLSTYEPVNSVTIIFKDYDFIRDELYFINNQKVRRLVCLAWLNHVMTKEQMDFLCDYTLQFRENLNLVHCKHGVRKTGTFIMYQALKNLGKVTTEQFVDTFLNLRMQRHHLVAHEEQLEFLYNNFVENTEFETLELMLSN